MASREVEGITRGMGGKGERPLRAAKECAILVDITRGEGGNGFCGLEEILRHNANAVRREQRRW
jgi:hypothetical protein